MTKMTETEQFDLIYKAALEAKTVDELKKKLGDLEKYDVQEEHHDTKEYGFKYWLSVAGKLAKEGQTKAVELLYQSGKVDVNEIAFGYVLAGNDEQVKTYINLGAKVEPIIDIYASLKRHDKVEEYRIKHNVDHQTIAGYYEDSKDQPPLYLAINKLQTYGESGKPVIEALIRLKKGRESHWNPYWIGSGSKIDRIIEAVTKLNNTDKLEELINDKNSDLYKALNHPRITPITFLGQFGLNQTKSLMTTRKAILEEKNKKEEKETSEKENNIPKL